MIYEPSDVIIERMKSERIKLTPARAMLLSMFNEMNVNGEFASVFAAEKLIYFMQRFGAKKYFKIDFKPYYYGPYSGGKVAHVLYHMNGSYITAIDHQATGAMYVDGSRNRLYWASTDGLYAMPLIKSKNNQYTTTPAQYNNLDNIDLITVNNTPQ